MVDQIQNTMSNLEQYRMTMKILAMWDMYRMPVIYAFGALLVLTIVLFVMKSCWKKWVLFFTILAGLTIVAFDGFKMYVDNKIKEAKTEFVSQVAGAALNTIEDAIPTPGTDASSKVLGGFKGLLK